MHASRGKITRAEPISALYEQGKVHHVGAFPELEDQLCSFMPGSTGSPDRLDALVWALTDLMGGGGSTGLIDSYEMLAREQDNPPADTSSAIRCYAAPGTSHILLITGRTVSIGPDRIVDCLSEEEAAPLRALAGWTVPRPREEETVS